MKAPTKRRKATQPAKVITRRDVVDAVNARRGEHHRLRYGAWQRAIFIARQRQLFPPDVLTAVAKHGNSVAKVSQ